MVSHNVTAPIPAAASEMLVALGMYAPNCSVATTALRACIGCEGHARIQTVLLLDRLDAADVTQRGCGTHWTLTASVLPPETVALGRQGLRINFPKTQHLFRLMLRVVPAARW